MEPQLSGVNAELKVLVPKKAMDEVEKHVSFRAKQADFLFRVRSCEHVGLRSRGISLKSLAVGSELSAVASQL